MGLVFISTFYLKIRNSTFKFIHLFIIQLTVAKLNQYYILCSLYDQNKIVLFCFKILTLMMMVMISLQRLEEAATTATVLVASWL